MGRLLALLFLALLLMGQHWVTPNETPLTITDTVTTTEVEFKSGQGFEFHLDEQFFDYLQCTAVDVPHDCCDGNQLDNTSPYCGWTSFVNVYNGENDLVFRVSEQGDILFTGYVVNDNADMVFYSGGSSAGTGDIAFHLDDDQQDSNAQFIIKNGGNSNVFVVNEAGLTTVLDLEITSWLTFDVVTAKPTGTCDSTTVGDAIVASASGLAAADAGLWVCTQDTTNGYKWSHGGIP